MSERTLWFKEDLNSPLNRFEFPGDKVKSLDEANLVSSLTEDGKHMPVIDIDLPVRVEPSTTEGHYHLYIDKELTSGQYDRLLWAMEVAGIIEKGFYNAWQARGMTMVRKPGEKKQPGAMSSEIIPPGNDIRKVLF